MIFPSDLRALNELLVIRDSELIARGYLVTNMGLDVLACPGMMYGS